MSVPGPRGKPTRHAGRIPWGPSDSHVLVGIRSRRQPAVAGNRSGDVLDHPVDAAAELADVVGVDVGEHPDPELVAAQLAVGLGVDDARSPAASRRSPPRRPRGSRRSRPPANGTRVPRTASRTGRSAQAYIRLAESARPGRGEGEAALRVQPAQLVRASGTSVAIAGVFRVCSRREFVEGGVQAEALGYPARRWRRSARPARSPAGTAAPATAPRRSRSSSAGRSSRRRSRPTSTSTPPAAEVPSIDHQRVRVGARDPAHRGERAGGGLVVRPGVDVGAGDGGRDDSRAGLGGDHAAGPPDAVPRRPPPRTWPRTPRSWRARCGRSISENDGDVPEQRRAAVAQRPPRSPSGSAKSSRQAGPHARRPGS